MSVFSLPYKGSALPLGVIPHRNKKNRTFIDNSLLSTRSISANYLVFPLLFPQGALQGTIPDRYCGYIVRLD